MYRKRYKHLQYKIDIIKIIIKYIFILYAYDIIKFDMFTNMLGQTLSSLTLTKPRIQSK
jgi:hypothetical protein